ncbi:hypothetical protein D3C78_505890 [compost metagenome]
MVADNPNFPTPPRPGAKAGSELAQLRAQVERLTEQTAKAQQHALEMGNRALELAAQEVRLRAEIEQLRGSQSLNWHDNPGKLVWDESEDEVRKRYGDVRIEFVQSISSHPSLNEYRVWPIGCCARHNPAGGHNHSISPPESNNPAGGHHHTISMSEPIYRYQTLAYAPHDSCRSRNQDLSELFGRFAPVFVRELIDGFNKMNSGRKGELVVASVDGCYRCVYRDLVDDL